MNKNKKIALLGCGNWGKNIARNLSNLECLSCIYDLNKNVSDQLNKNYGLHKLSIENTEAKIVYISLVNSEHFK